LQVTPDTPAMDTVKLMLDNKSQRALIISGGKLLGITTTFDFIKKIDEGKSTLENIKIEDIMTRDVFFVRPMDDLKHIVDLMYYRNIRFLPVVSGSDVLGIITRMELGRLFAERYGKRYSAGDLMTYRYTTNSIHDSLNEFFRKIKIYGDKYVIILAGEKVVGVVTPTDILKHLLKNRVIDKKTSIKDIMIPNPYTAKKRERCDKIANTMIDRDISGVPIVEEKLEGLVTFNSFLQFLEV
jgi:CBS domain-containing protein